VARTFCATNSPLKASMFLMHLVVEVGELPVPGHDVDAEQVAGLDHVHAAGPQRGARALPGVAAVEEQAGAVGYGAQPVDQRLQVCEAAHAAELLRRRREIQVGQRVRLPRIDLAELLQQVAPDQVRRAAIGLAQPMLTFGSRK
jgi:hypothetical protein